MQKKKCNKCHTEKIIREFYKTGNGEQTTARCRACICKRVSEYNIKNRKIVNSKAWLSKRFSKLKSSAIKRGINFSLSKDDFCNIITKSENCIYCGNCNIIKTIDRILPEYGYTTDNCIMCCLYCNRLKYQTIESLGIDKAEEQIKRITNFIKKMKNKKADISTKVVEGMKSK